MKNLKDNVGVMVLMEMKMKMDIWGGMNRAKEEEDREIGHRRDFTWLNERSDWLIYCRKSSVLTAIEALDSSSSIVQYSTVQHYKIFDYFFSFRVGQSSAKPRPRPRPRPNLLSIFTDRQIGRNRNRKTEEI